MRSLVYKLLLESFLTEFENFLKLQMLKDFVIKISTMRIYGNRQLKTVPGQRTRPTAARVREAVFNIWRDR